ncbi:MAG: putative spermidine/putrescine transport system substrate-binding protein [Clostridia bacterium]|jgi:putative spermidine/putrescine transport system substrate-binding protein|nr:transporter substrate-binding protein [Clostridiales bacterium]MDK2986448.1 putative spermidine/putrescine transport system substrate-binding protein [Clostridia bacterium]
MKKLTRFGLVCSIIVIFGLLLMGCGTQENAGEDQKSEGSQDEPQTLVISTWGFNEDKFRENVFEPFEKQHNVKIVLEVGNNADRLNKIRMNKNSDVDVIYLAHSFAMQGAEEGLFEKINRENIPNINQIYEIAKAPLGEDYGPAYTLNRIGIVYNSETVKTPIESWSDLWKEEFKNSVSIPDINTTSGPTIIFAAGDKIGVKVQENAEACLEEVKKLKPNLVKAYARSSEFINMFTQGEVSVGIAMDFAFGNIKKAVPAAQWVDPREGSFANMNIVNIVKGTDNKELAEKFINWLLSEEVQRANAIDKLDSPVNVNVELTEEEAQGLTYGKNLIESLRPIDWKYVNSVMPEWIDIWNREILQ